MQQILYENPQVDPCCYTWNQSNQKVTEEFSKLLPQELQWTAQAIASHAEDHNMAGIKVGSISSILYDPDTKTVSVEFRDTYLKDPAEFEGRGSSVDFTLDELKYWSIEHSGVSPNLEDEIGKAFPKYAVIRAIAEKKAAGEECQLGVYAASRCLRIRGADGQNLVSLTFDDIPLTETEKQMLGYAERLKVLREESGNLMWELSHRYDFSGITGWLSKNLTSEGRQYSQLDAEQLQLSNAALRTADYIKRQILASKGLGMDIGAFDFSELEQLQARFHDYLERLNKVLSKKL